QMMRGFTAPLKLSLVLENKGNVARDHLASERTYLAYVRTSLACASAGVALLQLFMLSSTASATTSKKGGIDMEKAGKALGATIVLFGLGILVLGVVRYFMTQSALIRGNFPVARNSLTAVAFILAALVGITFSRSHGGGTGLIPHGLLPMRPRMGSCGYAQRGMADGPPRCGNITSRSRRTDWRHD
ncbi:hypothetical protein BU15DRAFT_52305, partial [Melanogaster broomeanus]